MGVRVACSARQTGSCCKQTGAKSGGKSYVKRLDGASRIWTFQFLPTSSTATTAFLSFWTLWPLHHNIFARLTCSQSIPLLSSACRYSYFDDLIFFLCLSHRSVIPIQVRPSPRSQSPIDTTDKHRQAVFHTPAALRPELRRRHKSAAASWKTTFRKSFEHGHQGGTEETV